MTSKRRNVALSASELVLIVEALDSHVYWQLSDEPYRNDGFVHGPGADDMTARKEILACKRLLRRLEKVERSPPKR